MLLATYKNEDYGIESLVMTAENSKFAAKAIMRDSDANETISVFFGTLEQVTKAAQDFVK